MRRDQSSSTPMRSCPICRVGMVRTDAGWRCPQCGSAIVGVPAATAPAQPRENVSNKS